MIIIYNETANFRGASVRVTVDARFTTSGDIVVSANLRGLGKYAGASAMREVASYDMVNITLGELLGILAMLDQAFIEERTSIRFDKALPACLMAGAISAIASEDIPSSVLGWQVWDLLENIFNAR